MLQLFSFFLFCMTCVEAGDLAAKGLLCGWILCDSTMKNGHRALIPLPTVCIHMLMQISPHPLITDPQSATGP